MRQASALRGGESAEEVQFPLCRWLKDNRVVHGFFFLRETISASVRPSGSLVRSSYNRVSTSSSSSLVSLFTTALRSSSGSVLILSMSSVVLIAEELYHARSSVQYFRNWGCGHILNRVNSVAELASCPVSAAAFARPLNASLGFHANVRMARCASSTAARMAAATAPPTNVKDTEPCIHKLPVPFGARDSARFGVRRAGASESPNPPWRSRVEAA